MARTSRVRTRSGFTLTEMLSVLVVLGILSAVAAPALHAVDRARAQSSKGDLLRTLVFTQTTAMTLSRPVGIAFDLDSENIQMVEIRTPGAAPAPLTGPTAPTGPIGGSLFNGPTRIASTLIGGGDGMTIWFDVKGRPMTRDADGSNPLPIASTSVILFTDGSAILCEPSTGLITLGSSS